MIVSLTAPTDADVVGIYEIYRQAGEPDSPQIPFDDLPAPDQQAVVARLSSGAYGSRHRASRLNWFRK
jgi:hypothetical protein